MPIFGLDYKDEPDDGAAWLAQHGNPYRLSVVDADGRVGIDYGVYGVPETFVIDKHGIIRYKQIGPITPRCCTTRSCRWCASCKCKDASAAVLAVAALLLALALPPARGRARGRAAGRRPGARAAR